MKKEIMQLIESEDATLQINKYCRLHRWTKSVSQEVDRLEVVFSITNMFSHTYEIKARDWRGIVAEVQEAQTKAFADAADAYNKQLGNGYLG